jgi:hypothetical protein
MGQNIFLALKVPMYCPFVLLVEVCLREDKALGSEKGKDLGSGICYERQREFEQGLYCICSELSLILTLEELH